MLEVAFCLIVESIVRHFGNVALLSGGETDENIDTTILFLYLSNIWEKKVKYEGTARRLLT